MIGSGVWSSESRSNRNLRHPAGCVILRPQNSVGKRFASRLTPYQLNFL